MCQPTRAAAVGRRVPRIPQPQEPPEGLSERLRAFPLSCSADDVEDGGSYTRLWQSRGGAGVFVGNQSPRYVFEVACPAGTYDDQQRRTSKGDPPAQHE